MAENNYPLLAYNYRVTIMNDGDAIVLSFSEVSGLNMEYEPVVYKHGMSFLLGSQIIPGMAQEIRLTLKQGSGKDRTYLYDWFTVANTDPLTTNGKRDITVDLYDQQSDDAIIRWTVRKALPIKLETDNFDVSSKEVMIETMEVIAHSLQMEYL